MPGRARSAIIAVIALGCGLAAGLMLGPGREAGEAPRPAASVQGQAVDPFMTPLPNLDGEVSMLADFSGRRVLVNFWATWCAPCLEEIPDLARLAAELERDGAKALVVGIAVDETAAVRRFIADTPIPYPVLADADAGLALAQAFGDDSGVLPFNVVLSADGEVEYAAPGALNYGEAAALLTGHPR